MSDKGEREALRAVVWAAQHDATCSDGEPHPWTDHLPWDDSEDETAAIVEADAIIRGVRAALSATPEPESTGIDPDGDFDGLYADSATPEPGLDELFVLVPKPGEYFYIEDRAHDNYRGDGLRFVVDRRATVSGTARMYENEDVNAWLRKLVETVAALRSKP